MARIERYVIWVAAVTTVAVISSLLLTGTSGSSILPCRGTHVRPSTNLATVMASRPPGTTFCLAAGTFSVTSPIRMDRKDRVIGSGRNLTHIDGTGLAQTAEGIFLIKMNTYFAHFDIFGAPTPVAPGVGPTCMNSGEIDTTNCGKAFSLSGGTITVQSVDCHDNGGNCIGGGGSANVIVDDLNCYNNGNAYSRDGAGEYAACIKRSAGYLPGNHTTVTNSWIHDNYWVGIWCDFCKYGLFDIENNVITNNGNVGVKWEISGGWTSDDRAIIKNNSFQGNNWREPQSYSGAIGISTANDVLVTGNTFGQDFVAGINIIFDTGRGSPQPDSRGVVIQNNTMSGDALIGCFLAGVTCGGSA